MPRSVSKFNRALQQVFPFVAPVTGSETDVFCKICDCKISVSDGARTCIEKHIKRQKHFKAAATVNSNRSIVEFVADNPAVMQLKGKELAYAFHAGKHRMSRRTADCSSKLVQKCFDNKFTCGATKSSKLITNVNSRNSTFYEKYLHFFS